MIYKNLLINIIHKLNIVFMKLRNFMQFRLGILKEYQPNPFQLQRNGFQGRSCEDRFHAILKAIPENNQVSVLDIGCNIGYFTFRFAELGGFCIGFEKNKNETMVAQALAYINDVNNVAFVRLEVNPVTIKTLPQVDVVLCLSVFHHWVKYYGREDAFKMMKTLYHKAKYLVFETGQLNETNKKWSELLAFMLPEPKTWGINFCYNLGYQGVQYLGEYSTSVSPVPRHLIFAEKQ